MSNEKQLKEFQTKKEKKLSTETKKMVNRILFSVLVVAIIILILVILLKHFGILELTEEQLQSYIKSTGVIAPLVYIGVSFIQVTFIPIPGAITIVAGNYLFGTWQAFLYSYLGMIIGAMFAFFLGKKLGRPFANWIVGSKEKVDDWLNRLKGKQNVVLFFMFLLPFFPDDILCTIAGLMPLSYLGFFMMQLVTRATSVGSTLLFMSGEVIPYEGWGLIVLGVLAVICILAFILSLKHAEKINDFFVEKANLLFSKKK